MVLVVKGALGGVPAACATRRSEGAVFYLISLRSKSHAVYSDFNTCKKLQFSVALIFFFLIDA